MSALAAAPARPAAERRLPPSLRVLARIEATRYARHPLFLVGSALALWTAAVTADDRSENVGDFPVIPAFFIGLWGIIVAARLTRSTLPSAEAVDAAPLHETTRTSALLLACVVPLTAGALVVVVTVAGLVAWPVPEHYYGTFGTSDRVLVLVVLPLVACLGGPVLGVAVGRWLRFPGAAVLVVALLGVWGALASYFVVTSPASGAAWARVVHVLTPYTTFFFTNAPDEGGYVVGVTSSTGSPRWYVVEVVALTVAAAGAALLHGATRPVRARVLRVLVVAVVVAVGALGLAASGGNAEVVWTEPDGSVRPQSPSS